MANFLCIGIPARNEEKSISKAIRAITASDVWKTTPHSGKELIVCVNDSKDNTVKIVEALSKEIPELRLIVNAEPGKNNAMNRIVSNANPNAKEIYFSDADVLVQHDTIGKVLSALRTTHGIDFAAPVAKPESLQIPKEKRTPTQALYAEGSELGEMERMYRLSGMGFAARRKFLQTHPLPEHPFLSDDRFINLAYPERIKIVYDAHLVFREPTFTDHLRQRIRHRLDKKIMLQMLPELASREKKSKKDYKP